MRLEVEGEKEREERKICEWVGGWVGRKKKKERKGKEGGMVGGRERTSGLVFVTFGERDWLTSPPSIIHSLNLASSSMQVAVNSC